jgi:hypothetical protein
MNELSLDFLLENVHRLHVIGFVKEDQERETFFGQFLKTKRETKTLYNSILISYHL